MKRLISKLLRDENGQALTEYALVAFWGFLFYGVLFHPDSPTNLRGAMRRYYDKIVRVVCLPLLP